MMAIDLDTGEAHRLRYGSGPSTGDPLFSGQGIWSEGGDLFVSNGSLWRLEPVPGVSGREIQLPELGFDTGTSEETPDLSTGVVRIAPVAGPAPFAAATFSLTANGVLISETTVPTSPAATAGRLYAVVNETENTGVAFHNPSPQPVEVAFYFTDSAGVDFGHGTIDLEPGAQIARFVSEPPFDSGELEGTMTFESAVPVAALALHTRVNDRADFLMTHVPVGPVDPAVPAPEIVPNFVIGGGWESRLVLVNPTDSVVSGRFETPEFTGARIFAPPDFLHRIEGHPGIGFPYFIEPRSSSVVRLAGPAPEAESGFIRLVPVQGATPDAFAIATASEGDTVVHDATFVATPGAQRFRLYGRQEGSFSGAQAGSMDAGFAIANPGNETAEVRIDLLSSLGTHGARGTTLLVEPGRQFAAFLGDIPIPGPSLRIRLEPGGNLVRLSSDREIVVAGLRGRYNSRGERLVSSVPAVGESLSPRADPTYLAHFANGAGYTTEWHVFPVSGVASATLDYLEPGGDPVFVPLAP
jgi:hypothetical protein